MVWFNCDDCGDAIKKYFMEPVNQLATSAYKAKAFTMQNHCNTAQSTILRDEQVFPLAHVLQPKLDNHHWKCRQATYTCIDCSRTFTFFDAKEHNMCVTEEEKYAQGATKPGGYAHGGTPQQLEKQENQATGFEFLSERPPFRCTLCNVSCTSRVTLMSHAQGDKHRRRVRARLNSSQPPPPNSHQPSSNPSQVVPTTVQANITGGYNPPNHLEQPICGDPPIGSPTKEELGNPKMQGKRQVEEVVGPVNEQKIFVSGIENAVQSPGPGLLASSGIAKKPGKGHVWKQNLRKGERSTGGKVADAKQETAALEKVLKTEKAKKRKLAGDVRSKKTVPANEDGLEDAQVTNSEHVQPQDRQGDSKKNKKMMKSLKESTGQLRGEGGGVQVGDGKFENGAGKKTVLSLSLDDIATRIRAGLKEKEELEAYHVKAAMQVVKQVLRSCGKRDQLD